MLSHRHAESYSIRSRPTRRRFESGTGECLVCRALDGFTVGDGEWDSEEKMRSFGFWLQPDGMYRPHPNCRCRWRTVPAFEGE